MNKVKALQYMEIANAVSRLSKDTSTQVGAVVLGPSMEVRSLGYNGAPRGCRADEPDDGRTSTRPEKYFWVSHAELNAITNAARAGIPLDGCVMLVTHPPCMDCARAIVQSGIKEVITLERDVEFTIRWGDHTARSTSLFQECGIEYNVLRKELA